jgi:uncharacterized membrane protein
MALASRNEDRLGLGRDDDDEGGAPRSAGARLWLFLAAAAALVGAVFAAYSTSDFIQHLDRQMHSIHCSIVPGGGASVGESGCRTVMMSPYSSLFRTSMWGGMPISLLALGTFAYLAYRAADLALKRTLARREVTFLVVATLLPVGMSAIYGYISTQVIHAVCTVCVGIYGSSVAAFVFALLAMTKAERAEVPAPYARWFAEGVGYVGVLVALYMALAPQMDKSLDGCGTLAKKDDPNNILIPFGGPKSGTPAIAVLDPLCPSCKAFDERMQVSGLYDRLSTQVALFPLDKSCNWNVRDSMHPGACAIAEAMLCDRENFTKILDWAFARQEELINEAKADESKLRARLEQTFPAVKGCLGTPQAKLKVAKSLKWAVANGIPVLTPQLFIGDQRVCDEDTDLGLEYTVNAMIARTQGAPARGGRR